MSARSIAAPGVYSDSPIVVTAKIVAIILAAAVVPALVFAVVYRHTIDMPFWDEWDSTPQILAIHQGHVLWHDAWAQHNEHRIIVPLLIYLAINRVGSWSNLRETLFGLAILTLVLPVLWRMTVETMPRTVVPFVFLALSMLSFSLIQAENLIWGGAAFGWNIPNLLVLLGLYLLTRRQLTARGVAGSFCACFAAAFSQAPGLDSLIVGIVVLAVRAPFNWRWLAAWVCGTIATFALYLSGFNPNVSEGLKVPKHQLLSVYPHYVAAYLGAPLGAWQGLELSQVLGTAGLLAFIAALWYYVRLRLRGDAASELLPWLAVCGFVVLNAFLTGYGRAGIGVGQALSSRYTTLTTDLWIGIIGLSVLLVPVIVSRVGQPRTAAPLCLAVLGALFVFLFINSQIAGYASVIGLESRMKAGADAVRELPYASDDQLRLTYPDTGALRNYVTELQRAAIEL